MAFSEQGCGKDFLKTEDVAILYFRSFYIVIAEFTLLYSVALFYCFVRKAS